MLFYSSCAVLQCWAQSALFATQIIELERKAAEQGQAVRGSAVAAWANTEVAPEDMYFVDSRGDRNNLVYEGLYRADIAAYHRTDPSGVARGATKHHGRQFHRQACSLSSSVLAITFLVTPYVVFAYGGPQSCHMTCHHSVLHTNYKCVTCQLRTNYMSRIIPKPRTLTLFLIANAGSTCVKSLQCRNEIGLWQPSLFE